MTIGSEDRHDEGHTEAVVDSIVSRLGLRAVVETDATVDHHAADVAELIADAAAERARFEDTLDAS